MKFAFHSFKGGVGRTKLMVGVATELTMQRKKLIGMLDFDLDASGLNSIFLPRAERLATRELTQILKSSNIAIVEKAMRDDPMQLLERVYGHPPEPPGRLHYLPTVSDPDHSDTIELLHNKDVFLQDLLNNVASIGGLQHVLIDLKPGYSPAYRATREHVDRFVVVARLDRQNIDGLAKHIPRLQELGKNPIIVVNMKVDLPEASDYLDQLNEALSPCGRQVDLTVDFDPHLFFDDNIKFMTRDRETSPMRVAAEKLAGLLLE